MEALKLARLETLCFSKLASKDPVELEKLLRACQQQGFFYLLADSDASDAIGNRLKALCKTKAWFDRPTEEKMKLYQDSVTKGFVIHWPVSLLRSLLTGLALVTSLLAP